MKIMFKTRATATGGRSGHTALDDGSLAFDTAMPGSGKPGVNPEQLFALGYAACFDNAVMLLARQSSPLQVAVVSTMAVSKVQATATPVGYRSPFHVP